MEFLTNHKMSTKGEINIMADNSKFIPKIPETRTEIILNQEQQTPQEQKSTTEKVADSIKNVSEVAKETIIPTAYTSDDKNNGRGSPKIVQEDNK